MSELCSKPHLGLWFSVGLDILGRKITRFGRSCARLKALDRGFSTHLVTTFLVLPFMHYERFSLNPLSSLSPSILNGFPSLFFEPTRFREPSDCVRGRFHWWPRCGSVDPATFPTSSIHSPGLKSQWILSCLGFLGSHESTLSIEPLCMPIRAHIATLSQFSFFPALNCVSHL